MLLSERSGEFYTDVANGKEDCQSLHEIPRADYVLFVVDGEVLASDARHGIKSEILMMFQALVEAKMLRKTHRVGVVLSKYDFVKASENPDKVEKDFNNLVQTLQARYGPGLAQIKPFIIAARPENETVQTMFGVMDLLEEWLMPTPASRFIPPSIPGLERAFHRLDYGGADK